MAQVRREYGAGRIKTQKKDLAEQLSLFLCGLVTDFRTFYNDYLMVVKFFEWLKEKAEV